MARNKLQVRSRINQRNNFEANSLIYLALSISFTLFQSCDMTNDKSNRLTVSRNEIESSEGLELNLADSTIDKLERLIVSKGDTIAYNELRIYYMRNAAMDRLLYYSIIMAHKYQHSIAYKDAAFALKNPWRISEFDSIDNRTKALIAYFYLCYIEETGYDRDQYDKMFKYDSLIRSNDILKYNWIK